jgi:16S rRNA (adenine1518-N6/adenine1519-N6)-dimethyltransferase
MRPATAKPSGSGSSSSRSSVRPAAICATCAGTPSSTSGSEPKAPDQGRPRADKRLGQHFLFDPSILRRIAAAPGDLTGRTVIEVGPGPGGLTRALLATGAARVVAVERDPRFVAHLRRLQAESAGRLLVVEADALTVDPTAWGGDGSVRIVANLPYNVATPLLFGWFDRLDRIATMVLMFQKEVAARLAASPGSADYGRLAVMAQLLCRVERLFDLPPAAFTPPPKVSSSVVRLTPRPDRPADPLRARLAEVTRAAFGQRRKMLRSSLRSLGGGPAHLLAEAGIDGTRRAEELSIAEFLALAGAWRGG